MAICCRAPLPSDLDVIERIGLLSQVTEVLMGPAWAPDVSELPRFTD
jgi:hypothetical protein